MSVHETTIGPIEVVRGGCGAGDDGAAVLLHAAASGPRALFKLASALNATGMTTACPALHGYGATRIVDVAGAGPFAAHVAAARWTFDGLQAAKGRRILFGHSMGGTVALLATLDGAKPDALVVYEPIVLDILDRDDLADAEARAWDAACIDKLHAHFAAGEEEEGVAAFVEAYNEVAWTKLPAPLRDDLVAKAANLVAETRAAQDLQLDRAALAALTCPVLILQGDRSPQVTQRMCSQLARAMPPAVRRIVPEAGHMGPVMSHEAVAREIGLFLAETRAR